MNLAISLASMSELLVSIFDDQKVTNDLNLLLSQEANLTGMLDVTYPSGKTTSIPVTAQHTVLSVILQQDLNPKSLRVRVFCALGGAPASANGIVYPKHGFAMISYNQDGLVYTYDLHNTQFYDSECEEEACAKRNA